MTAPTTIPQYHNTTCAVALVSDMFDRDRATVRGVVVPTKGAGSLVVAKGDPAPDTAFGLQPGFPGALAGIRCRTMAVYQQHMGFIAGVPCGAR